jgi:hypothetical protein
MQFAVSAAILTARFLIGTGVPAALIRLPITESITVEYFDGVVG